MLHKIIFFFISLITTFWIVILQNVNATVIVSLKPLGFITSAITDGVIDTQVLLPDGVSEHNYFLRPSDIKRIQDAELVIWIGPEMEIFMAKLRKQLAMQKQIVIAELDDVNTFLAKNIKVSDSNYKLYHIKKNNNNCYSKYDMHLWLSPEIAWFSAIAIHDKLIKILPHSKDKLDANLKDFKIQLIKTDRQINDKLNSLKGKGYFVFHDAYGYYEKHYGLTPLGYFVINPEIQPSAQRLHQIRIQLIKKKAICIFTEPQLKPITIGTVTKGVPIRMGVLDPLGTNIQLSKQSYLIFLSQLANQYVNCLKNSEEVNMCNR